MKKLLLVLGILSISALGFADAKSDFENAQKLAGQKNILGKSKLSIRGILFAK